MWHGAARTPAGDQCLHYSLYDVAEQRQLHAGPLPLSPGSTLSWVGFRWAQGERGRGMLCVCGGGGGGGGGGWKHGAELRDNMRVCMRICNQVPMTAGTEALHLTAPLLAMPRVPPCSEEGLLAAYDSEQELRVRSPDFGGSWVTLFSAAAGEHRAASGIVTLPERGANNQQRKMGGGNCERCQL